MKRTTTLHTLDTQDSSFIQKVMTVYGLNEINSQMNYWEQGNQTLLLTIMSIFLGAFMGFSISIGNTLLIFAGAIPLIVALILNQKAYNKKIFSLYNQQKEIEIQGRKLGLKLD